MQKRTPNIIFPGGGYATNLIIAKVTTTTATLIGELNLNAYTVWTRFRFRSNVLVDSAFVNDVNSVAIEHS